MRNNFHILELVCGYNVSKGVVTCNIMHYGSPQFQSQLRLKLLSLNNVMVK